MHMLSGHSRIIQKQKRKIDFLSPNNYPVPLTDSLGSYTGHIYYQPGTRLSIRVIKEILVIRNQRVKEENCNM